MKQWVWQKAQLSPRILYMAFGAIAVVVILSVIIEVHQSRKEFLLLMRQEAHNILETAMVASQNAILSNQYIEESIRERLLNNAAFVRFLYENGQLSNELLARLAKENRVYRIVVFNHRGEKIFASHPRIHQEVPERFQPKTILAPILRGDVDTLYIGIKRARFANEFRYAVALATPDRGAIVVNLDAEKLLAFRKTVGFGNLVRSLAHNPGIIYLAIQDTTQILAASGAVEHLEPIPSSAFLQKALQDSVVYTRFVTWNGQEVFEAVHPFYTGQRRVGLFRIGLATTALQEMKHRLYRRLVIVSVVLTFLGFVLVGLVLARQNLEWMHKKYQAVETYSSQIIENVSDAVLVWNERQGIQIFNRAAEQLLGKPREQVVGKPPEEIFPVRQCLEGTGSTPSVQTLECEIQGQRKYLLFSRGEFVDAEGETNVILVIRDLTEQKRLERQMQRQERLIAMGELASGVAHEIRNPLNAIATTVQQLDRDFEPREDAEEYHQMMQLVYREVRRINQTINEFLQFARPAPLRPSPFPLEELMAWVEQQYTSLAREKQVQLQLNIQWNGTVEWDKEKMKQVLGNLIQNALDVLSAGGRIQINARRVGEQVEIRVKDDGPGIPESIRSKIFNLYFTTKASGTGVGLAIVQRIVYEHEGVITVESEEGEGNTFILQLPLKVGAGVPHQSKTEE